ncbi:MAG: iron ABC transporter ATP-binding protein [Gammaproteobacteria bacterium HGW-Gammaproteobacteria-14]|nr:MAG: iron ABC transporter ATP-binding protein [Gammaproteobacteria bacterium HGW-Gammaproteobacteria-14]
MTQPLLQLDQIACHYDSEQVVHDISFALNPGQIACLLGPSGCGKTTTLRAIAGLESLSGGRILINGEVASKPGFTLAPEKRGLGMVFQEHALFPHLSVADNVAFALRQQSRAERQQRVRECLAMVRLDDLGERFPHELSGGQQQRVALARAVAPRPRLILLDEPFASLDLDLRRQLNRELLSILKLEGVTAVMVTHDQEEAFAMASHIAILRAGKLLQWDTPYRIYHAPGSRFVAEFAGQGAFLHGKVITAERVSTTVGELSSEKILSLPPGSGVDVLLRPEDVVPDLDGPVTTRVLERTFTGANILYRLGLENGEQLTCLTGSHVDLETGRECRIRIAAKHLVVFPEKESSERELRH